MPIKEKNGVFVASYAGQTRKFKKLADAKKWAAKFTSKKKGGKKEVAEYSPWRSPFQKRRSRVPGKGKVA